MEKQAGKTNWGNGRSFRQQKTVQTMNAYENDPIINYMIENLGDLDRHCYTALGIANLLEVRERLYPKLFKKSIDEVNTPESLTDRHKAYLSLLSDKYNNNT